MGMSMDARLSMEHSDAQRQVVFTSHAWRMLFADTILDLEDDGTFSFQLGGARRQMSWRQSILALDLRGYWDEISSSRDFLTTVPSYIQIRDPLRRLCHCLISHNIAGRGHAPEKIMRHLAWVAPVPKRQQVATAGALEDVEGAHAEIEGDQAIPEPVQARQPPPTVAQTRTMPQRIARLEEEVHGLRQSIVGLHRVVDRSITDQARFATWMISCMTQLMDASVAPTRLLTALLSVAHRCHTRGVPDRRLEGIEAIMYVNFSLCDVYNVVVALVENMNVNIAWEKEEVHVVDVEMDEDHEGEITKIKEALQWSLGEYPFLVFMELKD
ncbi:hypothetical protein Tco_1499610 [Tanacetum coccineum]